MAKCSTLYRWRSFYCVFAATWLLAAGGARTQDVQPAATPKEDQATSNVEARLEALTQRVAGQERVIAQQQAELDSYKAKQESTEEALIGLTADDEPAAEEAQLFRLYGFADVGAQRSWGGFFNSGLGQSDALNFVLGNVNLYFDATPLEHVRMLTEVRFMTLPNGAESAAAVTSSSSVDQVGFQRISTTIFDVTAATGGFATVEWGGILLERAQIEWNPIDWIKLRAGYFLTPLGIWNIDHGSPTRIMLRPPVFITAALIPERQTGIELHGVFHAMPWEVGYSAYISNGRTFGSVDFSDDKAVGGRLILKTQRPIPMQLGGSIYYGTAQDYQKSIGIGSMGSPAVTRRETISLRELAGGLDVSLDLGSLRIRAEFVARRVVYEQGKRESRYGADNASGVHSAGYLVLAYRLPWLGLEPLMMAEYLRQPNIQLGEIVVAGSVGLNVYFNPTLILRTQYSYGSILDIQTSSVDHGYLYLHILATRLIVSY